MTNWIEWNGGKCPIKSDNTLVAVMYKNNDTICYKNIDGFRWSWINSGKYGKIIAYRIIEDNEPMAQTRESITAQIETLQKQLDEMPVHNLRRYWDSKALTPRESITAQIETLQKQLDEMPDEKRGSFWIGVTWSDDKYSSSRTHEELVTIINGVPHIHGIAMKEITLSPPERDTDLHPRLEIFHPLS
jgi:hypothetical protein